MKYISKKASKIKEKRPLEPFVSKEQIIAFAPERPETFTESKVVNEVLLAIESKGLRTTGEIAAYLAVDGELLRPTLQLVTGMTAGEIFRLRIVERLRALRESQACMSADEAARAARGASLSSSAASRGCAVYLIVMAYFHIKILLLRKFNVILQPI